MDFPIALPTAESTNFSASSLNFAGIEAGKSERFTLNHWTSEVGDAWFERNRSDPERVDNLINLWREIGAYIGNECRSALEIGAGLGDNCEAISIIWPHIGLHAIEPNTKARRILMERFPSLHAFNGSATRIPLGIGTMDIVFTSGCLIHVPPSDLPDAYREIYRVAKQWIVVIEYFSANPEEILWRGRSGLLFKRDFGQLWLDIFPTLQPVACGFAWKAITKLDNLTWWIFRK